MVVHFLDAGRGQDDKLVVPVPTSLDSLEVVALGSCYSPKTGAAPYHVDDHSRQLLTDHV